MQLGLLPPTRGLVCSPHVPAPGAVPTSASPSSPAQSTAQDLPMGELDLGNFDPGAPGTGGGA